jgi:hypothetical protein
MTEFSVGIALHGHGAWVMSDEEFRLRG